MIRKMVYDWYPLPSFLPVLEGSPQGLDILSVGWGSHLSGTVERLGEPSPEKGTFVGELP
ncbi:hypothetical protein HS1genome_1932 [Sulfodiicoccus acidiphilus]|uniref:Uncharacterized protein n=1 Tax=Sulfodiicoccus acidiphilus TaxID=1670455 RepID=A0A348B5U1_9CREN|nr:hypothetical protein HS1genome_1932 [Sulfodiicoccus acidiphilus]GGT92405.1 hypothetical protein GCM10007116_07670 [Sulfodiicoccus acidiphilus]